MSRIDSTQNFRVVSESENRVEDILQQDRSIRDSAGDQIKPVCLIFRKPVTV